MPPPRKAMPTRVKKATKKSTLSPQFRNLMSSARRQEIVLPAIRTYLFQANFPGFEVHMPGTAESKREPDGWFHPSTHPSWPARQLYYYLVAPELLVVEPMDLLGTMATTAGTFWHAFLQACLLDQGIIEAVEVEVEDEETGSRGSLDGRLNTGDGWEFKTMNPMKMSRINTVVDFIERCPDYYMQAIEYMRLSGYPRMVFTILNTSYPFDMKELIIPYERSEGERIREKYLIVRQAVADQRLPMPCCSMGSKMIETCPARLTCPVATGEIE